MVQTEEKLQRVDTEKAGMIAAAACWIPAFLLWTLIDPRWTSWMVRLYEVVPLHTILTSILYAATSVVFSVFCGTICASATVVVRNVAKQYDSKLLRIYFVVIAFAFFVFLWGAKAIH